jgi:cadmium resistance protein CadD (predicted permease)
MIGHIALAISTFIITNIDDLLLLTYYFSSPRYRPLAIVSGQYLGISLLIVISLAGLVLKVIIPYQYLGILGIFPVIIGIKALVQKENSQKEVNQVGSGATGFWSVAAITIANGGDNIGVYTPLFAHTSGPVILIYITVFLILTGLFCYIGYFLVNHPRTKDASERYGKIIMPYFLILLGLYILSDVFTEF